MEYNKSLSARIKRRNACGHLGIGNHNQIDHIMPSYDDVTYNHKDGDYKRAAALKQKLRFALTRYRKCKVMSKKFADNHQKL